MSGSLQFMMKVNNHDRDDKLNMGHELDQDQKLALETFFRLCKENDLLGRPDGMGDRDALDAINDETALMYVNVLSAETSLKKG